MQIQQIRNATLRIRYAKQVILTDPVLSAKHAIRSFAGNSPNPTVDLPCTPMEVINGVDAVMVSHLHVDHFDPAAQDMLPKDIPLFCQPNDEQTLRQNAFKSVTAIDGSIIWNDIEITRASGQHGTGAWGERMGKVSGFVFKTKNEPTIYWAGDTIWCGAVRQAIRAFKPDIIITTGGGAPLDNTFYQSVKGPNSVKKIVKKGGVIILASACKKGIGSPEFTRLLFKAKSVHSALTKIRQRDFFCIDQWMVQHLCHVLERAEVYFYSRNLKPRLAKQLLVKPVSSVEEGIRIALDKMGHDAKILVIPSGPYVIPSTK